MSERNVILACCAIGAATVVAMLAVAPRSSARSPDVSVIATEDYGKRLVSETAQLLGPHTADARMRYSGSGLTCGSCHLGAGLEPGTLSLLPATQHYPRQSPRVGGKTDIEDRVNECMQRSMNGRALPGDSPEMIAMASYIRSLGARNAAMGASLLKTSEPPVFHTPNRAADLNAGKKLFDERCARCHGRDGSGLPAASDPVQGYVFPPLWGPDSFNDGAGMHRVLTAARFIKARMPLGKPDLNNEEAFDVAGYMNSQPRPHMANLERDYPDRRMKPVDTGYGPYADPFPQQQHQFGPFQPIEAYYRKAR